MGALNFYDMLDGQFDSSRHLSINVTYTAGQQAFFQLSGQTSSNLIDAIFIHLPASDGPDEHRATLLQQALINQGCQGLLSFFSNRFYLHKEKMSRYLPTVSKISWLQEKHRSAAYGVKVRHEPDFHHKDRITHSNSLTILFHKDFKTLEQQLESKTLKLTRVKTPKEVKHGVDTSKGSAFPLRVEDRVYLITAKHCIDGSDSKFELEDFSGQKWYCKGGKNSKYDVQLLEPESEFSGPTFDLSSIEQPEISDEIFVCGYPGGLGSNPTISNGHISKLNADYDGKIGLLQISSAAVNPQNSGGPVTDYKGNIVGILTLRPTSPERLQNIAFAEPIYRALKDLGVLT